MKFRTLTCITAMTLFIALSLAGNARAQTFTRLFSFNSTDGSYPSAGLVQATNGNLYGTTTGGGVNGEGTVFEISLKGATTLYSFCSQSGCADGANPEPGLVQATDGNLYGTTRAGGNDACGGGYGCGTVFKITPRGTLTTLYSFCSQTGCADGEFPYAALIQATNGNFYGTTASGGMGVNGYGTIFSITATGTLTTLLSFDSFSSPYAALIQATDGNFYGTARNGGNGDGSVFRITPRGVLQTVHKFEGTDGEYPMAGLVQATDGNFYGTTSEGGTSSLCGTQGGCGTVFEITPSGTLTTLYSFCSQSGCTDGEAPNGLVQATDGNFYGTTQVGGANSEFGGTIFKITTSGTLTTLYSFCYGAGCPDGYDPDAALVQDTDGRFYGTTVAGGGLELGTVFSLNVGLGPFVETNPPSGKVGASVKILGTNLTGATSVTFNGTPATFVVGSANGINATVPAGATTGTVVVVTPSGTLSSNVPFRVTQ